MMHPARLQRRSRWGRLLLGVCLASLALPVRALQSEELSPGDRADTAHRPENAASGPATDAELDRIQRAAFRYVMEQRDPASGLVYNTSEANAPASPTASGVALSAIPIGIERGWISREDGYRLALQIVQSLGHADGRRGFFYHFLTPHGGTRTWDSEVSGIDSAVLFAGAMVIAEYFQGTEVATLANQLIDRAEWPWFLDGEETLKWSWRPETGFEGGMTTFSESILAYLLAMGSQSHPIPPSSWDALKRPISRSDGHPMVYTPDGSLFAYLLPLAWFDLRDRHDAYLDYWTNAKTAIESNIQFCRTHQDQYRTYREGLWGLSAALGPSGYKPYGAMPGEHIIHDGTVAPYVVAASMPLLPQAAIDAYRRMERLSQTLWTKYGLGNALNLDRGYACQESIALDQGLALLMVENMRTGLIWRLFMHHPVAQRAMAAAGFVPGSLNEPKPPAVIPGNPGASMTVPMVDHAVTIDGDLHEWIREEAIELTPVGRRNVESGSFRDAKDASALIFLGWTDEVFYVAGIVLDDEFVTRREHEQIYRDDCLELFWDLDGDGFRFDANPHDIQIGLAPGGPQGAWQLWAWGPLKRMPSEVKAALIRQDGHVEFELAIPRTLLPGLVPGVPVRFGVDYHDRDTDDKEGKLTWSIDTASVPGTILFGQMTLSAGPTEPPHASP